MVFLYYIVPSGAVFIYTTVFNSLSASHPLQDILNDTENSSIFKKIYQVFK